MAIANDLSHLPRAGEGLQPDASPRFVQVLVEKWEAEHDEAKPNAIDGTRFRHSNAGKCARLLGYVAAGIPASDPMDLSGINNVALGQVIHDLWQGAFRERFGPVAQIEVKVRTDGADGSGHIDAVVRWAEPGDVPEAVRGPGWDQDAPSYTIAIELKSIGGYGFKSSIGRARKGMAAEGPKNDHLLQAALNAQAMDADEAVICYIAKEALSKSFKVDHERDRFLAEWTMTREQFEPLATAEAERVSKVLALVDKGQLPRRVVPHDMPPGAEIVSTETSTWEVTERRDEDVFVADSGSLWGGSFCSYCSHQTLCEQVGPGRVSIESVVVGIAKREQAEKEAEAA